MYYKLHSAVLGKLKIYMLKN